MGEVSAFVTEGVLEIAEKMDGPEVDRHAHAVFFQGVQQFIAPYGIHPNGIKVMAAFPSQCGSSDERMVAKASFILLVDFVAAGPTGVQSVELAHQQGRVDVVQIALPAEPQHVPVLVRAVVSACGVSGHSMQGDHLDCLGEFFIARGNGPAFPAGQVFGGIEAVAGRVGEMPRPDAVPFALNAVCAVLHDEQAVPVGDGPQGRHVAHGAVQVHGNDGLGPGGDGCFHRARVDAARSRVHIDQHGGRSGVLGAGGGSQESHGAGDDLVARTDAKSGQGHVHGRRTGVERHYVRKSGVGRELAFEFRSDRPGAQEYRTQHLDRVGDVGFVQSVAIKFDSHDTPAGMHMLGTRRDVRESARDWRALVR